MEGRMEKGREGGYIDKNNKLSVVIFFTYLKCHFKKTMVK